jgi:FAD/FMN-containing dehydrogenase
MGLSRRDLIRFGALSFAANGQSQASEPPTLVNDVHSQLNLTSVVRIVRPESIEDLRSAILQARRDGYALSISGSRHAMGGQQFAAGTVLLDMRAMNRVLAFNPSSRILEIEAGIEWPELLKDLAARQSDTAPQLGIFQKQTGADRLSIGGALSSNVHGRGLKLKPIINDVESFQLMNAEGELTQCDRSTNPELFRLAIGGYGLFGVITSVCLRLTPRVKVRRVVILAALPDIPGNFADRIRDGYLYGDFQFATDSGLHSFMRRGIFSCYQPVDPATPLTQNPTRFHPDDWARLTYYAHTHKRLAFNFYTKRYLATSGQVYYHDWQLSAAYQPDYHLELDRKMHAKTKATEMITEIYIPRSALINFMEEARRKLREQKANLVYGTVRLVEKDDESFLRWAREPWACVIFNLHIVHDSAGLAAAQKAFRMLIDVGIAAGGSYYLTYHRWATRQQVETCYPQFREFLAHKLQHDPAETFQSDWYRHHKRLLA